MRRSHRRATLHMRLAPEAAKDWNGYRSRQYKMTDATGRTIGGVGATIDPKGRVWTGGVPEKAIWSFGDLKGRETRGFVRDVAQMEPGAKTVVGMAPQLGAKAMRAAAAREAVFAERAAKIAEGPAVLRRARLGLMKREYTRRQIAEPFIKGQAVIPLAGSKPVPFTAREAMASKGLSPKNFLGGSVRQGWFRKAGSIGLLGLGATLAATGLHDARLAELEQRNPEAAARERKARRALLAASVVAAGVPGFAKGLRAGRKHESGAKGLLKGAREDALNLRHRESKFYPPTKQHTYEIVDRNEKVQMYRNAKGIKQRSMVELWTEPRKYGIGEQGTFTWIGTGGAGVPNTKRLLGQLKQMHLWMEKVDAPMRPTGARVSGKYEPREGLYTSLAVRV